MSRPPIDRSADRNIERAVERPAEHAAERIHRSAERSAIEARITVLAEVFARDVIRALSGARLDELIAIAQASGELIDQGGALGAAPAPIKRKRNWPTCSEVDCGNSYYPASGTAHLCYRHFIASGGRHPSKR